MSTNAIPARWTDLTAAQYHADGATVSRSQLTDFLVEGPAYYHGRYLARAIAPRSSDAMTLGTVVHNCALRGMKLADFAEVIPESALTKDGKRAGNAWKDYSADCAARGVVPLKDAEYSAVLKVLENLCAEPVAMRLIEGAERRERSCEWQDDETGLVLRCMFDLFSHGWRGDLKTTSRRIDAGAIAWHVAEMRYDWQAAFYQRGALALGAQPGPFYFVACQVAPPYEVGVFCLSAPWLEAADAQIADGLRRLADRLERDDWSRDGAGRVVELGMPKSVEYRNLYQVEE